MSYCCSRLETLNSKDSELTVPANDCEKPKFALKINEKNSITISDKKDLSHKDTLNFIFKSLAKR